jgi:hypothetical protein
MEDHRLRVLVACDACKSARRRCDGSTTCSFCARRGYTCHYTQNRKRGRASHQASTDLQIRFVIGCDTLDSFYLCILQEQSTFSDESGNACVSDAPALTRLVEPSRSGDSPLTLSLTDVERDLLRSAFDFTNRILTTGEVAFIEI